VRHSYPAILFCCLLATSAAADPCAPREATLRNPFIEGIGNCIFFLSRNIEESGDREFAKLLIARSVNLAGPIYDDPDPGFPLDFSKLAELANLVDDPKLIGAFVDFVTRGCDNETLCLAAGRLYELQAPAVLNTLAAYSQDRRARATWQIAWGLANNFYPRMDRDNYARLSVGANWEVLNDDYPHREISQQVESALLEILAEPSE